MRPQRRGNPTSPRPPVGRGRWRCRGPGPPSAYTSAAWSSSSCMPALVVAPMTADQSPTAAAISPTDVPVVGLCLTWSPSAQTSRRERSQLDVSVAGAPRKIQRSFEIAARPPAAAGCALRAHAPARSAVAPPRAGQASPSSASAESARSRDIGKAQLLEPALRRAGQLPVPARPAPALDDPSAAMAWR